MKHPAGAPLTTRLVHVGMFSGRDLEQCLAERDPLSPAVCRWPLVGISL